MRFVIALLLILFSAACGGDDGSAGTVAGGSVEGRHFLLESASGFDTVDGTTISIRFDDGTIGADAGCNSMSGPFELDDDTLVVAAGLATTEIGCDPERHAQDQALAEFITSSPTLTLTGDTLVLETASTRLEMLDRDVVDPDRPLVGTTWELDGLIDGETASSLPQGVETTVRLSVQDDVVMHIDGPCSSGTASIDSALGTDLPNEGELDFGLLDVTVDDCDDVDAAVTEVGEHVFAVFSEGTVAYEIEADRLTITRGALGLTLRAAG